MLNIEESKVMLAMESCQSVKSLDANITDDLTLLDVTPSKKIINTDLLIDLKEAFKYLDNSEKKIIIDRYYNNLTQSEVADVLGVNQVYVSRKEKKALIKMKSKMI